MISKETADKYLSDVRADQVIFVEQTARREALLTYLERDGSVFREIFSAPAFLGKEGTGKTREGDLKTPLGTYGISVPFGIKDDPGSGMPYTKVTDAHYWCSTSGDRYYNRLVDAEVTGRECGIDDEHLIDFVPEYDHAMFVEYNKEGREGLGSAIFLHCTGKSPFTAGCIAVGEEYMTQIIRRTKTGAVIIIAPNQLNYC